MKKKPFGDDLCTWLFFGLIVFFLNLNNVGKYDCKW